jgi:hypothetical protein
MHCPRCKSTRIQRGYQDAPLLLRLSGGHGLLCNNCGLEFKRFKWSETFDRTPTKSKVADHNRRRAARFKVHLPTAIRLVDQGATEAPSFSPPVLGHCQTISTLGMALSFVGSRFDPAEVGKPGRHLLVVITLPSGAVEALVKMITHERVENPDGPAKWIVGASIVQISEADSSQLSNYLEKRSSEILSS